MSQVCDTCNKPPTTCKGCAYNDGRNSSRLPRPYALDDDDFDGEPNCATCFNHTIYDCKTCHGH